MLSAKVKNLPYGVGSDGVGLAIRAYFSLSKLLGQFGQGVKKNFALEPFLPLPL